MRLLLLLSLSHLLAPALLGQSAEESHREFSGIYPHLASFNRQNECGTGAVVPWAGRLWWITYAPHRPDGSDDKLYSMDASLAMEIHPESVGGTPANRMIHRETEQLLIGPYLIDRQGRVRVIPPARMRGRLTGNARHLAHPADKVYYATMEEGLYEVDVRTLAVTELFPDGHNTKNSAGDRLPGYHGKGLYSGQGRLVYANNGEKSRLAQSRPDIPSGALAEWRGGEAPWRVVRRNQFTEVTGPGGITGNSSPGTDPVWSIGWDHRSLILMTLHRGRWHRYRLPKASHCYDGAHGWNTEWPRIRDIGEHDLLMTMHGTFWRFPRSFTPRSSAGIAPRSSYLTVVGDFCRFGDRIVFGCDNAARSEFLNTRRAKGRIAGPAESQSNLWFVDPGRLDRLGPNIGRGGVWVNDVVGADEVSDPFLFSGYERRTLHLSHDATTARRYTLEVDRAGDGRWTMLRTLRVPPNTSHWHAFDPADRAAWIRIRPHGRARVLAWFELGERPRHDAPSPSPFRALATAPPSRALGGLLRAGDRATGLQVLATHVDGTTSRAHGYYELTPDLRLVRNEAEARRRWMAKEVAIPRGVLEIEDDTVVYTDDAGRRFRLPVANPAFVRTPGLLDLQRTSREAATERDLFQAAGTFFELPARNAGGFAKIRPIASHDHFIQDYASWRGLLVLTGIGSRLEDDPHVIRSADRGAAVWLGALDDLWQLGKPRGRGALWRRSAVRPDTPSDPLLMTGYDEKQVLISHEAKSDGVFTLEVDVTGDGDWRDYRTLRVAPGAGHILRFPTGFEARWLRVRAHQECVASAHVVYR